MQKDNHQDSDAIVPRPLGVRIFLGVIALIALIGIVYYFGGIREIFFFSRTDQGIVQPPVVSTIAGEEVALPLTVHIFKNDEFLGSERDEDNARHLVKNADALWEQANINLFVDSVIIHDMSDEKLAELHYRPRDFASSLDSLSNSTINVFLLSNLQGINGISYGGMPVVAVADKTTVYDYRALAHEIGHQLGLHHVLNDDLHLMSQGVNGYQLTPEEIKIAREVAQRFILGPV